jgi:hypothetical protein
VLALLAQVDALSPSTASLRAVRRLHRRARRMGRCDLLPGWMHQMVADAVPPSGADPGPLPVRAELQTSDLERCLAAKAGEHDLALPVLRTVFKRGLSEYAAVTASAPLPVGPEEFAHARVNTFIRLHYGDDGARADDADLLGKCDIAP